jgi:translation initiation factor IF-2
MARQRVYEIAKAIGVPSKEIIFELEMMGFLDKKHSSGLDDVTARTVVKRVKKRMEEVLAAKKIVKAEKAEKPKKEERPKKVPKEKTAKESGTMKDRVFKPKDKKKPLPSKKDQKKGKTPPSDGGAEKKPSMAKALESLKKIDVKKWPEPKPFQKKPEKPQKAPQPKKPPAIKEQPPKPTAPRKRVIKLKEGLTVKEFAELIGQKVPEVIKKFMDLGYMPTINQPVDQDAAQLVAETMGIKLEIAPVEEIEEDIIEKEIDKGQLEPRPPIVTVMGHVDHGKTSLLDVIRKTNVTEKEVGGITQHIGAYKIKIDTREIVFLDTPGHEAFTAMRARGSKVTDIVILVVAADDGVMPQTIEAINHAKAAEVPIIVAINKIDKANANIELVKQQLAKEGVVPEDWGGENIFVEVSAKQNIGLDSLLEMILLQADMMELKADYKKLARGTVVESKLEKGKGPVATVIVQSGKLHVGDPFIVGTIAGRVRAITDDKGRRIKKAGPSTPVEVTGFPEVPEVGTVFVVLEDENKARQIALSRINKQKRDEIGVVPKKMTLDEFYSKIQEGQAQELNIIMKGDVQGSIEAIKDALLKITHPEVKIKVIHASVGGVNESDVLLATASNAIIIGFNVRPETKASTIAEREGVDIRLYSVIYDIIDDIKKAIEGMLAPTVSEKVLGRAEVRKLFHISRIGTIAGCMVTSGIISRASKGIRVIRNNIVAYDGKISSLKRFKEDAKEVQTGYECGITIENFNDIKEGDILENYTIEEIASKL